ncbi:hypothetical protein BS17DRAFT_767613 [Gyrodon lividus]|nr:hypothetical protein BS17DRAFT_767613 [Gyrodon lividus]
MSESDEHSSETESLGMEWGMTSKEEDMPPELEEEEGDKDEDSTEADNEREEEGVDMVAESRKRVPAQFSKKELTIMMNAKSQWMSCRGATRQKILQTMDGQLRKLDSCKALSNETWLSRVQAYKTCGANHSQIKVGCSWTGRTIIQETHKMVINEVIHKWYGKKAGTKEALSVYQKAVCRVVKQLTEEEWEEAENTAAEWNLDHGPLNNIKASGDFNDEIAHGEKFQGVQKISTAWDKYISTHFEPEGEPNTDPSDSEEESNPKQKEKQKRPDSTIQVTCEADSIWIGDVAGRAACAHPKAVAPFKKLPQHINAMFLEFIQGRQKDHPNDIFRFHHWIDENGDLQESIKGLSEAHCSNEDRIEARGSTSSTERLTRKKGKGKEKEKGKAPTENAVGVQDTTKVNFILGAKKKSKSSQRSTTAHTNMAGGGAQGGGKTQPSNKVAASRLTAPNINVVNIPNRIARLQPRQIGAAKSKVTSQPAEMPKAKSMSKQVRPIMVPVLGSEQESELNNNPLNKPASSITHVPPPSSKPVNKFNSMSKQGGTPHPTQKSTAHQTSQQSANKGSSAATSFIQADPPESNVAGVQTEENAYAQIKAGPSLKQVKCMIKVPDIYMAISF